MSAVPSDDAVPPHDGVPPATEADLTVADVAFPDGREGLFGVRATSTVHAALVAFALSGMSLHEDPVPVLAVPSDRDDSADTGTATTAPTVNDVVGSVTVARLRAVENDAADDPVSDHLGPIPPALPASLAAVHGLRRIDRHEIGLVVHADEVVGVVSRRALLIAARIPPGHTAGGPGDAASAVVDGP